MADRETKRPERKIKVLPWLAPMLSAFVPEPAKRAKFMRPISGLIEEKEWVKILEMAGENMLFAIMGRMRKDDPASADAIYRAVEAHKKGKRTYNEIVAWDKSRQRLRNKERGDVVEEKKEETPVVEEFQQVEFEKPERCFDWKINTGIYNRKVLCFACYAAYNSIVRTTVSLGEIYYPTAEEVGNKIVIKYQIHA